MKKESFTLWLISLFLLFGTIISVNISQLKCDEQNPSLQCLLFKEYPKMNDELACQLCAVALQSGKYPQKINQYCNDDQEKVRNCGLTSFAYLITIQKFAQAFDLQYEIFYRDPFNHDQRVSAILRKQNIRQKLISWLQTHMDDQNSDSLLKKAITNLYIDDINQSQKQLESFLSLKDQKLDQRTIKLKCRIYERQGQFNEALNVLNKYIKHGQQNQHNYNLLEPYFYHLKGNLLMHHLKFDQAILEFKKANGMFKSQYEEIDFIKGFKFSNYNIGLCYQKLSKFDEAVKTYLQLVKNYQRDAEILNALGNSFIEWAQQQEKVDQQKIRKGIFYLTRAIQQNPEYYPAHYNLGYAYLKSDNMQKAIQKFKDSLKIKKTSQAQYALLTALFISGKYQDAQNMITKNMTVNDESIDDLLSVFYQYSDSKKNPKFYDRVLSQYEDFIKSANGHYWKAMIQFDQQNYGLAIDHFLQAYDKGYSEPHLLFNLAYSYELIEQYQSAKNYYEKAFKKDPRPQTKQKIRQCKIKLQKNKPTQQL